MNWWQYTLLSLTVLVLLVLSVRAVRGIFEIIHWICRRYGKTIPAPNIPSDLVNLRIRMERTNFWFHLVRNNPRHREQYYFALIAMVGYENWKNIDPTVRMNWESARLSFDRMYGMVKDFAENAETYAGLFGFDAPAKTSIEEILAPTKEKFEKLHEEMAKLPDKYNAVINNYQEISVNFKKQTEELKQIENSKKQLKECLETLSKLLPPEDKADKE